MSWVSPSSSSRRSSSMAVARVAMLMAVTILSSHCHCAYAAHKNVHVRGNHLKRTGSFVGNVMKRGGFANEAAPTRGGNGNGGASQSAAPNQSGGASSPASNNNSNNKVATSTTAVAPSAASAASPSSVPKTPQQLAPSTPNSEKVIAELEKMVDGGEKYNWRPVSESTFVNWALHGGKWEQAFTDRHPLMFSCMELPLIAAVRTKVMEREAVAAVLNKIRANLTDHEALVKPPGALTKVAAASWSHTQNELPKRGAIMFFSTQKAGPLHHVAVATGKTMVVEGRPEIEVVSYGEYGQKEITPVKRTTVERIIDVAKKVHKFEIDFVLFGSGVWE